MEAVELRCNGCGAGLRPSAKARFVTCEYCRASLEVKREGGAAFTVVTEKLEKLQEDVALLRIQNRLQRLDREWERQRQWLMHVDKHGVRSVPSKTASIVGGIVATAFGIVWTVFAFEITSDAHFTAARAFPFFGLVFVGVGIGSAFRSTKAADAYQRAEARYRRERAQLAAEVERARRA